jgi:hypothetical protein
VVGLITTGDLGLDRGLGILRAGQGQVGAGEYVSSMACGDRFKSKR